MPRACSPARSPPPRAQCGRRHSPRRLCRAEPRRPPAQPQPPRPLALRHAVGGRQGRRALVQAVLAGKEPQPQLLARRARRGRLPRLFPCPLLPRFHSPLHIRELLPRCLRVALCGGGAAGLRLARGPLLPQQPLRLLRPRR
jgi:hypothetical protein